VISTQRHIEYALGYIGLGLLDDAADELEKIAFTERLSPGVLLARIELHMAAKHWDLVVDLGRELSFLKNDVERAWITWAYALRELKQVEKAKAVLLSAELIHGKTSATLHYNLACYYSLLGDQEEAKERLRRACRMSMSCKDTALDDPDLKPLWNEIRAIK
jgi:tetratricopeptide (TPR) repeat protein